MRALLVGAGGMGRGWAANLTNREDVTLAGWVDIAPGAAERAVAETGHQAEFTGTDLELAIRELNPDFVVDVTIPEAHRDVTVTALGMGVPVIGEKPMAHSMAAAREMVRASEASGKLYMVSQSRRYDARLIQYRQLIRDHVGDLGILNSDFYIGAHFGGFRDEMDSPLVLDMAIHTFDAARYLSGMNAVAVYAEEFNPSWSWYRGDAAATAIFELENGARYTYRGSWCAEGKNTTWECDWRAVGANGSAVWDGHGEPSAEKWQASPAFIRPLEEVFPTPAKTLGGIEGSLDEFLRALRTGETPQAECHDNIHSLAMVFGVLRSSRERRRVLMEEILAE